MVLRRTVNGRPSARMPVRRLAPFASFPAYNSDCSACCNGIVALHQLHTDSQIKTIEQFDGYDDQ